MCGIAVILHHDGSTPALWRAQAMHRAIAHRGPDGAGVLAHSAVTLAHARLSIVDVLHGAQPMQTDDHALAISYNGEVYNYLALKNSLSADGARFSTASDTEVVLSAYRKFGAQTPAQLRGMFAFAIHDRSRKELFLARDRMGIKPLYYYNDKKVFVAASEIKAILASGLVKPELDRASIKNYFTYQFSISPHTAFKNIFELPPAHTLTISPGRAPRLERYWDVAFPQSNEYESKDEAYWSKAFYEGLQDATTSHAIGEVPISAYLSGGIDSCTVTRLLADIQTPVQTFSIGFDNAAYDESTQYRAIANHIGVPNTELRLNDARPQGYLEDLIQCIYHLEQPQRMAVDVPHYLLSGLVHENGYKVVYTGDGADEILGGYDCFRQDNMRTWSNGFFNSALRRWRYLTRYTEYFSRDQMQMLLKLHTRAAQRKTIERFGFYPAWHDFWQITRAQCADIMRDDAAIDGDVQMDGLLATMQPQLKNRDALNQSLYFEMQTRLPGWILWKSDRLSMAHSVEARVPFLDHPLVELAARMPPEMKLRGLNEKYILKQCMAPRLPPMEHAYKKRGFYTPISEWFFTPERAEELAPYLSREALIKADLFNPDRVEEIRSQLLAYRQAPTDLNAIYRRMQLEWTLFTVLTTQILHHLYVDTPAPARSSSETRPDVGAMHA
jgi:asparagine synthase (glutamine-hydrolysing)